MKDADWKPVCEGAPAERLRAAILEIATELRNANFDDPSLTGAGGVALMYSYLAHAFPDRGFEEVSGRLVEGAIAKLGEEPLTEALYGGFTGLAWCVEHLSPASDDDDDANEDIDDAVLALLDRPGWHFDLIFGLVGVGVYALERAPRPKAILCLNRIVDRLSETAEQSADGITWRSDPRFLGPDCEERPGGYYNLGLAHGVPGVIAFLGRACAFPQVTPHARFLLDGAVAWLKSRQLPAASDSRFAWIDGVAGSCRSAWCYGDPGVAAALLLAARSVGNEEWERDAIAIALGAAARAPANTQVVDAGLCHGSAGLAHIFNRLYQATREPRFADAARDWFLRTLEHRTPGEGVAGFHAHLPEDPCNEVPGARHREAQAGFLTGAAGVALAMLGAISPIAPNWDRTLLCSIPPASSPETPAASL